MGGNSQVVKVFYLVPLVELKKIKWGDCTAVSTELRPTTMDAKLWGNTACSPEGTEWSAIKQKPDFDLMNEC